MQTIGRKFGRWLVLRFYASKPIRVWCRCECGVEKPVILSDLETGKNKSCGCYRSDVSTERATTHGLSSSTEYAIYCSIKARCLDKDNPAYDRYGGRGIKLCRRWLKFENFIADVGRRPSLDHSLERRNNNKGYNPKNCYWATLMDQAKNTRTNVFLVHNGQRRHLSEWARVTGISLGTIRSRIKKGFTTTQILETPMGVRIRL